MFFKWKKKEKDTNEELKVDEQPNMNTLGDGVGAVPDYNEDLFPIGETVNTFEEYKNDNQSFNEIDESQEAFKEEETKKILEVEEKLEEPIVINKENTEKEKSLKDMSIDDIFMDVEVDKNLPNFKFCPNCGSKLDINADECFLCGIKIPEK